LHVACLNGHKESVRILLKYGTKLQQRGFMDPNIINNSGYTPLHCVCSEWDNIDSVEIIKLLLEYNVNIKTSDGWTPLHEACAYEKLDCIEVLLLNGANPNNQTKNGETPLHRAVFLKYLRCLQLLLQYGADPHLKDHKSQTARDLAYSNGYHNIIELIDSYEVPIKIPMGD
jgi:ankyrin repeat protein